MPYALSGYGEAALQHGFERREHALN